VSDNIPKEEVQEHPRSNGPTPFLNKQAISLTERKKEEEEDISV
jgi:hypothetical protein